jgi:hypothetical protein
MELINAPIMAHPQANKRRVFAPAGGTGNRPAEAEIDGREGGEQLMINSTLASLFLCAKLFAVVL